MDATLNYFFDPISEEQWPNADQWNKDTLGHQIIKYKEQDLFPQLEGIDLAFFSIGEFRGAGLVESESNVSFRASFYSLFLGDWKLKIADLGDFKCGEQLEDTYAALAYVVEELLAKDIVPIVIGGTQDLNWGIYKAFSAKSQNINYLSMDARFDLGLASDRGPWKNYMTRMIDSEPNFLLNYTHLGYQGYLCHADEVSLMDRLKFESLRLGAIKTNIEEAEPYIRNANICSVDLSCVKQADAPAVMDPSPNGFSAYEICGLVRYAGMSNHVRLLSISDWSSQHDVNGQTGHLVSQMLWHFIEGFSYRMEDEPKAGDEAYMKYIVTHKEMDIEFIFYKSRRSARWWVELPNFKQKVKRIVIPCSYHEYLSTLKQEVPERWFRYYNRF